MGMVRPRGRFIVFEGGEASGKSTQSSRLAVALDAVLTREPGGTPLGEQLRALLLDPDTGEVDARTELLLMAGARAEHVVRVIRPALDAGRDVVCDRFSGSSVAYQGAGRGLDPAEVARLSTWATNGLEPDIVVLLDVPESVRAGRRSRRPDRLEAAGEAFHGRVAEGFRSQAAADPERWVLIDGALPMDTVTAVVADEIERRLPGKRP